MTNRATMGGKPVFNVPYRSVLNMKSGFKEKLLCDGPTFSMGTACAYTCSYCYVPAMTQKLSPFHEQNGVTGKHEDIVIRRKDGLETLRRQLTYENGKPKFLDPRRIDRRVVYASPLVDVAANMDLVRETVEACKLILELTTWDIRLLSKSNLLPMVAKALEFEHPRPPLGDGLKAKKRIIYGVSTGTLDDKLGQVIEKGCPLVSKRIESLHWLQDNGFRTFGMICPSLPQDDYDQFAKDMATAIRTDKMEHVWSEVINVRGASFENTIKALEAGGFERAAYRLIMVKADRRLWQDYARKTFEAHAKIYDGQVGPDKTHKLRFLQYKGTDEEHAWWKGQVERGAVIL